MSRVPMRAVFALALLIVCGWISEVHAAAPTATVNTPVAGPNAGSVNVPCSWKDCTGVDSVLVIVHSKSPTGVIQAPKTAQLKSPPAILPAGNWTPTVTGLTTGHTVTGVEVQILPPLPVGGGKQQSIASDVKVVSVVVP